MKMKNVIAIFSIFTAWVVSPCFVNAKPISEEYTKVYHTQWLGPLPPRKNLKRITKDLYFSSMQKAKKRIAESSDGDILNFSCKQPAEVGVVPDLPAVDEYIDGLGEEGQDGAVISRLFKAAEKGNWLARLQAFSYLSNRRNNADLAYFSAKIFKWLIDNDVGGIYSLIGYAVEDSGYYSDAPRSGTTAFDTYAALHNGYPAQYKVGTELLMGENPKLIAIGKKMVECAKNSIPSYRRVFTGEAEALRAARKKELYERSYTDLHWAVLRNQVDRVQAILASDAGKVNAKTEDNRTAIELALLQKNVNPEIIRLLIEAGAEISRHPDVRDQHGEKLSGGLLSLATRADGPSVDVIRMLVEAGAEPFAPPEDGYTFLMPFNDSFYQYEEGRMETFDYFISTKKLDKNSEIAKEYLVESVGKWKVFNRLLDYGISPVGANEFLENFGSSFSSLKDGNKMLAALVQRYPELLREIGGEIGNGAVRRAIYDCNFKFANTLIAFGAPLTASKEASNNSLVRTLVERCGRTRADQSDEFKGELATHRKIFLNQMAKSGMDFNALEENCPAWTDSMCNPPADDDLVELFLVLGADPYRFYPTQGRSILESLISDCRVPLVRQALAKPPAKLDAATIKGLNRALRTTEQPIWEGHHCPSDFVSRTAATLISYGAQEK